MSTTTLEHHEEHNLNAIGIFGFWLYILSDCLLFATFFAAFVILKGNTYGSAGLKELISMPYVFWETMLLLFSSFTYGLGMLGSYRQNRNQLVGWLLVTFMLGLGFVIMEVNEFVHLYNEGHSWHVSGAMTSFFSLVGLHGLHVSMGLLWMLITIAQVFFFGLTDVMHKRLTMLGIFWHFLDIVWIFVFTIVYLMGVI